jgi:hypothetical protein
MIVGLACPACDWTDDQKVGQPVVPDVVGEIVGWRAWKLVGPSRRPLLGSVTYTSTVWLPRQWTVATCGTHGEGEVPAEGHSCGLYAAKTREQLVKLGYAEYSDVTQTIVGEVAFAGKVIPGSQGWRAARARIKRLYLPYEKWQLAEYIERLYGCDVTLANTWTVEEQFSAEAIIAARQQRR